MTKKCSKCSMVKSREMFGKDKNRLDGKYPWCKPCRNAGGARYRATNYLRIKGANAVYRENNRETVRARGRLWAGSNPEKVKARGARARAADPESWTAKSRRWEAENPDRHRASRQAYKRSEQGRIANRAQKAKRRSKDRGYYKVADVLSLFAEQSSLCFYCPKILDREVDDWHVDHYMPLSRGGANTRENLRLACAPCNLRKAAKDPVAFLLEIGGCGCPPRTSTTATPRPSRGRGAM